MACGHRYCQSCYHRITKQTEQCLYCSDVLKVTDSLTHSLTYSPTHLLASSQPQQEGSVPIRSGTGKPSERLARYAYIYAEVVSPEDLENLKNSINESVGTVQSLTHSLTRPPTHSLAHSLTSHR